MLLEVLTALTMVVGTFFMVVTGIGLVRFPDVYTRMHAAGKAGTVGVALLILAPSVFFVADQPFVTIRGLLAIVFQFLTTPGATYLLAHASYVRSYPVHARTEVDELEHWLPTYPDDQFGHE
ncbi:MAG: monovalent cation/H(+) antiporter subunit G [Thermodesulfobacteriota bacterium]